MLVVYMYVNILFFAIEICVYCISFVETVYYVVDLYNFQ